MWVGPGRKTIFFAIIPLPAGCATGSRLPGVAVHVAGGSGGALGRVDAIHRPGGSRRGRDTCRYGVDPRGFGHAASAGR